MIVVGGASAAGLRAARSLRAACVLALLAVSFLVPSSSAVAAKSDWFQSLLQPGTAVPCCDISDCHVTVAHWVDGEWWALVAGAWQAIPPGVVLNRTSIFPGKAVVCHGPPPQWSGGLMAPTVFCFVPPAPES